MYHFLLVSCEFNVAIEPDGGREWFVSSREVFWIEKRSDLIHSVAKHLLQIECILINRCSLLFGLNFGPENLREREKERIENESRVYCDGTFIFM